MKQSPKVLRRRGKKREGIGSAISRPVETRLVRTPIFCLLTYYTDHSLTTSVSLETPMIALFVTYLEI